MTLEEIFVLVKKERERQNEKWGYPQNNSYIEFSSYLCEEVGEVVKELNELHNFTSKANIEKLTAELIQVMALAGSIIEHIPYTNDEYRKFYGDRYIEFEKNVLNRRSDERN